MVNEKGEAMEPALHFHEFLFLLGLIAKNCITSSKDDSIQSKLQDFYLQKLKLKKVSQLKDIDLTYEEVLNRVYKGEYADEKYDKMVDGDSQEEDEWGDSESEEDQVPGTTS